MKQLGIIHITFEKLESLLQIPEDHHIQTIIFGERRKMDSTVDFVIRGPMMPEVPEGSCIPWINPEYQFSGEGIKR
jgi:hypothetical protein